jgi:DNA-binding CsgD family transcriptional regulator
MNHANGQLESGREAYRRRAWKEACRALSLADEATPLGGDDLDLLAMAAALLGRDDEARRALERAHQAHVTAGENTRAARSAIRLGFTLVGRGEIGQASGWFGRAQRLIEGEKDCVEKGYLLVPQARQQLVAGDSEGAFVSASAAAAIGERFGDADLVAFARHLQGRSLMRQGRVEDGLALLDEAMVAATAGELSPFMTGLVYCSVIHCCQQVFAVERSREWTRALAAWCGENPEIVAFTGQCLVHRAEILQLDGAWGDAIEEARRAVERLSGGADPQAAASALYQEAEVHRLRGEYAEAEEAYRGASRWGWEPQPGLALLRVAQGRSDVAAAQIRRVVGETRDRWQRARVLPACVEILLAAGDRDEAQKACRELEEIAKSLDVDILSAMAAHARGAVELSGGNAKGALGPLRRAFEVWQRFGAQYIAARLRVLIGLACRELGDEEGAALELDAARTAFGELGAAPDLARVASLGAGTAARPHGLTPRELEVLLLVAAGKTNKAIAAELFLSEKTVDRHVSNIFDKLGVSSRSAATAFAYENKLL